MYRCATTNLFEEEGHVGFDAAITDVTYPREIQGTVAWAALTTGDHPVDVGQI
jgi:hypothetical protein